MHDVLTTFIIGRTPDVYSSQFEITREVIGELFTKVGTTEVQNKLHHFSTLLSTSIDEKVLDVKHFFNGIS